jgi:toxin-antitoxin system PIN domain toxin
VTVLLDGSVLIALGFSTHVHHDRARAWFASHTGTFATCPITQGTLLRALLRAGVAATDATVVLDSFTDHERHEFWPDDRPYDATVLKGVIGHRQVTDAYLAALARARSGRLATLDEGLAVTHVDVAELLPALADT